MTVNFRRNLANFRRYPSTQACVRPFGSRRIWVPVAPFRAALFTAAIFLAALLVAVRPLAAQQTAAPEPAERPVAPSTGLQAAAAMEEALVTAIAGAEKSVVSIARVRRTDSQPLEVSLNQFGRLLRGRTKDLVPQTHGR